MIVADLDVIGVAADETKANTPLIVDGDRVLSLSISLQRVETIPRRDSQILQCGREMDVLELPDRTRLNVGGNRFAEPVVKSSSVRRSAKDLIIVKGNVSRDARQISGCRLTDIESAPLAGNVELSRNHRSQPGGALRLLDMNVCRLVALVAEKEEAIARNPQDGRHALQIRADLGLSQLKTLRG